MLIIMMSFSYTDFACWIGEKQLSYSDTPRARVSQDIRVSFLYLSFGYTEAIPDVILYPNKDARARSVWLQLGTAHIQSFTQTRQVSVAMGRRFFRFGSVSMLRARQPPTRFVWIRLGTGPAAWRLRADITMSEHLSSFWLSFREEILLLSSGWF